MEAKKTDIQVSVPKITSGRKVNLLVRMCLFFGAVSLGFFIGQDLTTRHWNRRVKTEIRHHQLVDLRGCLYAVDSGVFRILLGVSQREYKQNPLIQHFKHIDICRQFIVDMGAEEDDENLSEYLGQILIFFDGYTVSIEDILVRQLTILSLLENQDTENNRTGTREQIKVLINDQVSSVEETQEFVLKIEDLISRVW